MKLKVTLFGITREIVGQPVLEVAAAAEESVAGLMDQLRAQYPVLGELTSFAVAVNNEYAGPDHQLHENDEIALIPPVSGG